MTNKTKIALSPKELELVINTEWILTKQRILEKVYDLFGTATFSVKGMIDQNLEFTEVWTKNAKISRGENYQRLPYVMLDYPRYFSTDAVFAIRTFFWWGNFISVNLQLSGSYQQEILPKLKNSFSYLQQQHYWICVNDNPWQHHFEPDNFLPVEQLSYSAFVEILEARNFVKIAKKLHLGQFDVALPFIEQSFKEIIMMLKTNYRGDETDPSPGIPKVGFDL